MKEHNLELIEEMINNAKGNISDGRIFYLLWGWLVLIAATLNYILLKVIQYEAHWMVWPILMTAGGIATGIISSKRKSKGVQTYAERAMKHLWIAFIISLLLVLIGMTEIGVENAYPIIMILYGLGTFVSGGILKFKPLQYGALLAWICGIAGFYFAFDVQLILIAIAITGSYLIPGYLLTKKK